MIIIPLTNGEQQVARTLDIDLTYDNKAKGYIHAEGSGMCEAFVSRIKFQLPSNECKARPYKSLMRKLAIASYVMI
jgi:hypothetical protein